MSSREYPAVPHRDSRLWPAIRPDPASTARSIRHRYRQRRPRQNCHRADPDCPEPQGALLPPGEISSSVRPVSRFTRSRNSCPLAAIRQACVATARSFVTLRRSSFCAQTPRASTARSIDSLDRTPLAPMPSPRRTMREKLSTTRKAPRRTARHQHPAIIGAKINGAVNGVMPRTAVRCIARIGPRPPARVMRIHRVPGPDA